MRSERQTLRRLPQTGAILFTIGIYVSPLGHLSGGNIARMADSLATIGENEGDRRGAPFYASALRAFALRSSQANEDL